MNRRTFIGLSLGTATLPLLPACQADSPWIDLLSKPVTVAQFCDQKELLAIGKTFEKFRPHEFKRGKLQNLIMDDRSVANRQNLVERLENMKKQDFKNGDTLVLNGWVLSLTEARQCALYAIITS